LVSLNPLRLRDTQTEKASHAGIAAGEAEEELNGRGSARLSWIGRRFTRSAAGLEGGVNHEWFRQGQEKRIFRQQEGQHQQRALLLPSRLDVMICCRMRRVVIVVMIVTMLVCMGVFRLYAAAVMHFREEMHPNVVDVESKQGRRQQANPTPTRSRPGWQSALLT